jgi:hypothetical protein
MQKLSPIAELQPINKLGRLKLTLMKPGWS